MSLLRIMGALGVSAFLQLHATCRSPGEAGKEPPSDDAREVEVVELTDVGTEELTAREKKEWSKHVTTLLSPCPDQPVSIAQCVKEARKCATCAPAAAFIATHVRRGKTTAQIEAAFRIRFAPDQVKTVPLRDSPSKGPANAPVVIVEWADFECPFCAAASPVMGRLVKEYPGTVRIVFKHYPLSIHKNAEYAARAAVAAARQDKFWPMHDQLFTNQSSLDKARLDGHARVVGLDIKRFRADLEAEDVADAVARDRKDAEALDLEGTPMIWINGRYFNLDYFDLLEDLPQWIELEAELLTGSRPSRKKVAAPDGSAAPSASAPAPSAAPSASGVP